MHMGSPRYQTVGEPALGIVGMDMDMGMGMDSIDSLCASAGILFSSPSGAKFFLE